jgi:hypothetical protein
MTWVAPSRAQSVVTLSFLLLGGVASAQPRTDLSQPDLTSARQTVTVSGLEVEVLPSLGHGNGTGILAGLRFVRFLGDSIFIGGGAFAGPLVGRPDQTGGFGYGGFIADWEARVAEPLSFDLQLLIGGGGGTPAPGDQAAGFVLEPKLALGWSPSGKGLRVGLTGGYLFLPGSPSLSGFVVGLRLEFKAFSLSWAA